MSWDCWIADETGANKVDLAGPYQPQPIPEPFYQGFGSKRQCLSGASPGETDIQSLGHDSGTLEVNLVRVPAEIKNGILALYQRWDSTTGEKKPVRFYNSQQTYLCAWVDAPWRPERTVTARPERYAIKFSLAILGTV